MSRKIIQRCPHCGKNFEVEHEQFELLLSGKSACPACGSLIPWGEELKISEGTPFKVTKVKDIGIVTLTESKIIDEADVEKLTEGFTELVERHRLRKVVVNFHDVKYLGSHAYAAFKALYKRLKSEDGHLRLCNIDKGIRELFDYGGDPPPFLGRIRNSLAEAVEDLRPQG